MSPGHEGHRSSLDDPDEVRTFLTRHGFTPVESGAVSELAGGISCRVWLAPTTTGDVVVKQALPELRVEAHWVADLSRAEVEAAYGRALDVLVPGACPAVLASDPTVHAFVMAAAPEGSVTWKTQLMRGEVSVETARRVGRLLGRIHETTAGVAELATSFADHSHFRALRLEPYLGDIGRAHPDLATTVDELVEWLDGPGEVLVQGDVSPKNILVTPAGDPLLIDHEVAHWGRAAFDTAFVLTHLCLKAIRRPEAAADLLAAAAGLLDAYRLAAPRHGATADDTARVLACLLLARVDGRSPVDYLDNHQQHRVRGIARRAVVDHHSLADIVTAVGESTGGAASGHDHDATEGTR